MLKNAAHQRTLGKLLRRRRLEAGLSQTQVARSAGVEETQKAFALWELGSRAYPVRKLPALAAALGVPIASLLVDQLVLAEVRVSEETLARVKRGGKPVADEVAARLAGNLAALLLAEATRPPVDLSPGARAKPRRTREQLLAAQTAGLATAVRRRAEIAEERRQSRAVSRAVSRSDELQETA